MRKIKRKMSTLGFILEKLYKICLTIFIFCTTGCNACSHDNAIKEQEELDRHVRVFRDSLRSKAALIYLNRKHNRADNFELSDEAKKSQAESLKEELDGLKESNIDEYNAINKDIEQVFNDVLYTEFDYQCSYELVSKSFVMANILSDEEAKEIFKPNKIDYKKLVRLLYPGIQTIPTLIVTVKELYNSDQYAIYCSYMRKYYNNSQYDPLKVVLELEKADILGLDDQDDETFKFGKNSIEKDSLSVEKALKGLIQYLTDLYVTKNLGLLDVEHSKIKKDLSNNSI